MNGVDREKLPTELTTTPTQKQDPQTPKVRRTWKGSPFLTPPRVVSKKPKSADVKAELDFSVQRIEAGDQGKNTGQEQQKLIREHEMQLEMAKERARQAKSKLILSFIAIVVGAFVIYQLSKTNFTRRGSSDLIFFIVAIIGTYFGRGRWRRR